jgi:hypothetical protein
MFFVGIVLTSKLILRFCSVCKLLNCLHIFFCFVFCLVCRILDEALPQTADSRLVHDALREEGAGLRQVLRQGLRLRSGKHKVRLV